MPETPRFILLLPPHLTVRLPKSPTDGGSAEEYRRVLANLTFANKILVICDQAGVKPIIDIFKVHANLYSFFPFESLNAYNSF